MSEEPREQEIVIRFWDAVTLGFGFGLGILIIYGLAAFTVGIIIGIARATVS